MFQKLVNTITVTKSGHYCHTKTTLFSNCEYFFSASESVPDGKVSHQRIRSLEESNSNEDYRLCLACLNAFLIIQPIPVGTSLE